MKWSRKLYVGKRVPPLHELKWNIRHNAGMVEIYYIVLSEKPDEMFEIYPSYVFMQAHIKEQDVFVVGVARGYTHSIRLVRTMLEDVYEATGGFDVKTYFAEDVKEAV